MRQIMLGSAALMSFALPRPAFAKFGTAPHVASAPVSEARPPQSSDPDPVWALIRREEPLEDLQDRVNAGLAFSFTVWGEKELGIRDVFTPPPDYIEFVTPVSHMQTEGISFPEACRRLRGKLDCGELPSNGPEYDKLRRLYADIKEVTQEGCI